VRRSLRSRERILDALLALVRDGELHPTAQQVADRAGVGLRSVFRHFEDMETLYAELRERMDRELRPPRPLSPLEGSLAERLAAFSRARSRVYERITPFQRAERPQRWRSPTLQDAHATLLREQRKHLQETFPEIDALPAEIRHALEVVTGFEFWELLRTDQGLGTARAEETVRAAAGLLLSARPDRR
jgi:AcrR family transcriptional regulator